MLQKISCVQIPTGKIIMGRPPGYSQAFSLSCSPMDFYINVPGSCCPLGRLVLSPRRSDWAISAFCRSTGSRSVQSPCFPKPWRCPWRCLAAWAIMKGLLSLQSICHVLLSRWTIVPEYLTRSLGAWDTVGRPQLWKPHPFLWIQWNFSDPFMNNFCFILFAHPLTDVRAAEIFCDSSNSPLSAQVYLNTTTSFGRMVPDIQEWSLSHQLSLLMRTYSVTHSVYNLKEHWASLRSPPLLIFTFTSGLCCSFIYLNNSKVFVSGSKGTNFIQKSWMPLPL